MQTHASHNDRIVTADMLRDLPQPVQRYLTYTGVVGQPWITTARVQYQGKFRLGFDKPWMGLSADQSYTTNPPGFQWKAHFKLAGLPLLTGRDIYTNSHGHMFGKLAGIYKLFDARGDELDQGTMLRYLQEMIWFPSAFLGDNITWAPVDDHAADVTFHDGGRSVTGRMFFDDQGRLLTFEAERYREVGGSYTMNTWNTPMVEYGRFAGLTLPTRGMGVWNLDEGDLVYVDLHITNITYNQPIEAF